MPEASVDSTLPAVPFDQWLAQLGGVPVSAITWEVNDCGEGGDGREAPTCVEAILRLTADTTAHASLVVAGIDGRRLTPAIWDLSVGAGYSFTGFKTLREWAAYVHRHRRRAGPNKRVKPTGGDRVKGSVEFGRLDRSSS